MSLVIVDGNNFFRMKLQNGLRSAIRELKDLNPTFCVWDGYNSNASRREIFSAYKAARKERDLDTDFQTLNFVRKTLLPFFPCISVWCDGYEGDDVIAFLAGQAESCTIISTDKDLAAIPNATNPLVKKEFVEECGGRHWIPLYKTLVGDPSDGIPGLKGFGKKSWQSLSNWDKTGLELFFEHGVELTSDLKDKIESNKDALMSYWKIVHFLPIDSTNLRSVAGKWDEETLTRILDKEGIL